MTIRGRTAAFCGRFGLRVPILLAPMAGVSAPALSIAVAKAGGLGACGALLMTGSDIVAWADQVRAAGGGNFQINLWIPDPDPVRDADQEGRVREFLSSWGPAVPAEAGNVTPPDFTVQCAALLQARAPIVSSVMGLYPPEFVARLKTLGIAWFANTATVAEAQAAGAAGADVIVVQGMEAGGHRGCFDASLAERGMVGLASLVPAVVDAVRIPVVATGGIGDGRGVAAALALGASAAQIGTGFLRAPQPPQTRRNRHRTRCSADSRRRCGPPPPRQETWTACRRGRGSPQDWPERRRRGSSCSASGMKRRRFCDTKLRQRRGTR